jgi:Fe-S cluster assembly iron-binding protein IscA
MALDEPSEKDVVQDHSGFRVFVDRALLEQSGTIQVDYLNGPFRKGFHITSGSQGSCQPSGSCSCS